MTDDAPSRFTAGPRLGDAPVGDPSKEAVASLRGYAYQLYASAIAWVDLQPGQELFLEIAEDYAVAAENALRSVQVKDTGPTTVTINSQGVRNTLDAYVGLVESNPEREIYVRFLSTSPIGRERETADRIDGKPALEYWRQAATAADVTPLRRILAGVDLSQRVRHFIDERDNKAFRDQFLKRIQWDCGRPPLQAIQDELADRVSRYASDRLNVPLEEARRLTGPVLKQVLDTIVHRQPRRLTDLDLRRLLEDATSMRISRRAGGAFIDAAVSQITGQAASVPVAPAQVPHALEVETDLPLPPILAERKELITDVINRIREYGLVVITGGTGRGKTIVARLTSRTHPGTWHIVDLRNASAAETSRHIDQANAELASSRSAGVILDDLNEADDPAARSALTRFLSAARRRDVVCLLTAYTQPSGRTLTEMGLDPSVCVAVPDFTVDEVGELIATAGGDRRWCQAIHMAGAFGHPQLVNAIISGLRSRAWPIEELKALRRFEQSIDVEAERLAARKQLVAAVPEDAKALLYRVSLMIGRFDRQTVLSLAELKPKIPAPGEQLDLLVGAWVEQFPQQQLRVSPLLANAGQETLAPAEQVLIHRAVAEAYTSGTTFDVGKADPAFLHGLIGKSENALAKLAFGVLLADQNTRKKLAEWITGIRLHRTDRPIFEQNKRLSLMLRLAQLLLVVHERKAGDIAACWEALQRETNKAPGKLKNDFEIFALGKLLSDLSAAALLPDWVGLILRFGELIEREPKIIKAMKHPVEGIPSPTPIGMLFLLQAIGIRSVRQMKAVFDRLDTLPPGTRRALLADAAAMPSDFSLVVNHAWHEEHAEGSIDWLSCAGLYLEMAEQAQTWGIRELALRCYIARGIMFDEYAEKPDDALSALDEAEKLLGRDPALSRARAKVHYRRKDHSAALAILRETAGQAHRGDPVERAFMLREAGISAAETGDWNDASQWFEAAEAEASQAHSDDMKVMAVGLCADHAIAAFQSGRMSLAFGLMSKALVRLGSIDPASSRKAAYTHRVIRHALLYMNLKATGKDAMVREEPTVIVPGMCSNTEPPDTKDLPLGHIDLGWYLLAEADGAAGDGSVFNNFRDNLSGPAIPAMEFSIRIVLLVAAMRRCDSELFLLRLLPWIDAALYSQTPGNLVRGQPLGCPTYGEVPKATSAQQESQGALSATADSLLAFGIFAALSGRSDALQQLSRLFPESGLHSSFRELVGAMAGELTMEHGEGRLAAEINKVASQSDLQPDDVFVAALRIIQFLGSSNHKIDVAPALANWLRSRWTHALAEQRFLIRNPASSIPPIEELLKDQSTSIAYCAKFLLATSAAATTRLGEGYREFLIDLSKQ